jgi:transposase-like protein
MKEKRSGRTPLYDNSLKVAVAREYLTTNLSYKELGEKHGIATKVAEYFVSWYRKHYPGEAEPSLPVLKEEPEKSKEELSTQLRDANLKIAGLEMLIEIAQKELGIDIVKKPGTKQSSK